MRLFWRILWIALLLLLAGCRAPTRERPQQTFEIKYPLPVPTPTPIVLPRFTPHVTSPAPTIPPTPLFVTATPNPASPGMILPPPTPTPGGNIYIVQPGDTLYDIAQYFHVPLDELARVNDITDPTAIYPGQQLVIP